MAPQLRQILPKLAQCQSFSEDYESHRDIVLYTLWCSGELSYYKLLLMTGIDSTSLNEELESLVRDNEVKMLEIGDSTDCFTNAFTSNSFRLVR